MEINHAIDAFAALGQPTRLSVLRLLVTAGHAGLAAGEIGRAVEVPHNTLSTHLQILERAGLAASKRQGRSIRYAADYQGIAAVITFLMQDCCKGHEAICNPVIDAFAEGFDAGREVGAALCVIHKGETVVD
ncbi:MAG: metalloregulator ArsR/SmtB family transcription factor, partial [Pseudomonadota bacterium]